MSSAYLNLVSEGSNGDSHVLGIDRSLFKCGYAKPMNFGMQKYEIDPINSGIRLEQTKSLEYRFEISPGTKNIGDLLLDTHLVVVLPSVWSPINADTSDNRWRPFEFKWIPKLGANIIENVTITIDNRKIQEFDGYYLQNIVEREFDDAKRRQFYEMIGHVEELNDPAKANGGEYPHASHGDYVASDGTETEDIEPSIRSRTLVIPLMAWYSFSSKQAVPLCCMSNKDCKMVITVTLRPARSWYVTKNVGGNTATNDIDQSKRKHLASPDTDDTYFLRRFVKEPYPFPANSIPDYINLTAEADKDYYGNATTPLSGRIYMVATTVTLKKEEFDIYRKTRKEYLFKQTVRIKEESRMQTHNRKIIESAGLVANVTLFFQRDDVKERNEYSNYTNWSYENERNVPLVDYNDTSVLKSEQYTYDNGAAIDWDLRRTGDPTSRVGAITNPPPFRTTGAYNIRNERRIMRTFKFIFAGKEKERDYEAKVISNIDAYTRCNGANSNEVYFYSFELDSDPHKCSPTGVINANFYSRFELDYTLFPPPINPNTKFLTLCDFENNMILGTAEQDNGSKYMYNYDMYIYIERYNKLVFENGDVDLAIVPV